MTDMARQITTLTVTDWRYLAIAIFELARARIAYACEPAGRIVSRLKDASAGPAETPAPAQMPVDIERLAWAIARRRPRVYPGAPIACYKSWPRIAGSGVTALRQHFISASPKIPMER